MRLRRKPALAPLPTLPLRTLAVLLLLLPLAGCLGDDDADPQSAPQPPPPSFVEGLAANVPPLRWDAEAGVQWWADFSTTYTKRDAYLPNNDAATGHIADALAGLGLEVQVLEYPAGLLGPTLPAAAGPLTVQVVVGMKPGTVQPDHAIAIGAHYDTFPATVEGAYDNGSGTAVVFNLCQALAQVPMQRTLLCLFFDGEELGALGSAAYLDGPPPETPAADFYLGFDMVGLNWPGKADWKLNTWVGDEFSDALFPFANQTVHGVLGYPDEGAEVFAFNDRNSDEARFAQAHVPTLRLAGGRTAGAYPQYHLPGDTVAYVEEFAGGRESFQAGFEAALREAYTLALMLDQTSLEEMGERM